MIVRLPATRRERFGDSPIACESVWRGEPISPFLRDSACMNLPVGTTYQHLTTLPSGATDTLDTTLRNANTTCAAFMISFPGAPCTRVVQAQSFPRKGRHRLEAML